MGMPPASAFLDQISNVQNSASRGGEFADGALASRPNRSVRASQLEKDSAATKPVAFTC
jgi:hypothetical protein